MMTYLDSSKDFIIFHKEKESCWNSRGYMHVIFSNFQKLFKVTSLEKRIRGIRNFKIFPLFYHFDIAGFMRDVGEDEVVHDYFLTMINASMIFLPGQNMYFPLFMTASDHPLSRFIAS
jgi:hypothetical protein